MQQILCQLVSFILCLTIVVFSKILQALVCLNKMMLHVVYCCSLILALFQCINTSNPPLDLIFSFSKHNHISFGAFFTCFNSPTEKVNTFREIANSKLRFIVVDVNVHNSQQLSFVLRREHSHFGVIYDGRCANSLNYFREQFTGKQEYFFEMYHWLIFNLQFNEIEWFFSIAPLNINSDVHIALPNETNNGTDIFDIYNQAYNHGGTLNVTKIGLYTKRNGYEVPKIGNKYFNRRNMSSITFKSAVVKPESADEIPLEEYLNSDDHLETNSQHRFQYTTIQHCRDLYNFSLEMSYTKSWGYIQSNGRFDGLVRLLEQRLIDFGSSPLIFKLDRMPVIDYSYGSWILRSTFIYRRPKVIPKSYEIFLRPLSKNVWLTVLLFMSVILLSLRLTFHSERRIRKENISTCVDSSWSFLILFTLGAFCQQGATCYPKMICSRILSVFVFLFCILIYQFYSASIVSYLLMDPPRTINNLKDLVSSQLRAGIEDILIDRDYFVQTTDPYAIQLYITKIKGETNDSGFYDPEEGLRLVRKGGFAFHVETSTAYPIIEKTFTNEEICDLEEVQMYRTQPMHTNLQKHSPFREMMNYCNLKMLEVGSMFRLRKKWNARQPTCIEAAKKVELHVSLKEFSSGLIVLFYGICASLSFLFAEFIIYYRNDILNKCTLLFEKSNTQIHPYAN